MILHLEKLLKAYNELTYNELQSQNQLIDDIWVNSQKYLILSGNGLCVKPYPDIISRRYEQELMHTICSKINKLHKSNDRLGKSLSNINAQMIELKKRCNKLDYNVESPFILGTYNLKSLGYTRQLIEDLYEYFHEQLFKLKCWAQLIAPEDSVSIEDYRTLIHPCKEYENRIMEYLDSCKCMRSKRINCVNDNN
ncbi:uncharacterized protein LOC133325118 [Musca vetustissima]|uniref:uncharacterized protein LOC133325118 n=1 Tax=Musca vetustissima TaxID=27455 RepID=UPI002AB708DD|nr:uncharacterized protein LOC133325118 [Musca vetustissima]